MPIYEFAKRETARFQVSDSTGALYPVLKVTTFERLVLRTGERINETPTKVEYQLPNGALLRRVGIDVFVSDDGRRRYLAVSA